MGGFASVEHDDLTVEDAEVYQWTCESSMR